MGLSFGTDVDAILATGKSGSSAGLKQAFKSIRRNSCDIKHITGD